MTPKDLFLAYLLQSCSDHQWTDVPGEDIYEWLVKSKLAHEGPATEPDEEWDVDVGDTVLLYSDEMKELLRADLKRKRTNVHRRCSHNPPGQR